MGLSSSALPLLLRLRSRGHVDRLALTHGAASGIESIPSEFLVDSAVAILKKYWHKGGHLIVVGAIGAVVRLVAPFLSNKEEDPAVVVMDALALNVLPLIGTHKAGSEQLALEISEDFGGNFVSTGDASNHGRLPLDSFGDSWGWKRTGNSSDWHDLMLRQARGESLFFSQTSGSHLWRLCKGATCLISRDEQVANFADSDITISSKASTTCCWRPPTLWVGIGCERNTSFSLFKRSLETVFRESDLAEEAVAGLASIDLKQDEVSLVALAKEKNWPISWHSSKALARVLVPNPSELVKNEVGTASVAEAAALLSGGQGCSLRQNKQIFYAQTGEKGAITIAIAESVEPFAPQLGELHLVGSGPGDISYLTNDARLALSKSSVWVGYGRYLDLLEPLRGKNQVRIDGELTFERDRCKTALALASQGIRVALISSGDSGIYGMAGLALELLLELPECERPWFQVHPGVSAFQMAASKVGAPLMQDFCAISLSDRLTPWEKIEDRLRGAAIGDFVIAIFNPCSNDRDWQLARTIEVLQKYRSSKTPVLMARQVGRPEEKIDLFLLENLPINKVDMLTLLLIGNTSTEIQDGWMVTPRGYRI